MRDLAARSLSSDHPRLARLLAGVALVGPFAGLFVARAMTPWHDTVDHWSDGHLATMLLVGVGVLVVCRSLGTVAYHLWPRVPLYPPLLAGLIGGVLSGWGLLDALNVRRDHSPAGSHPVRLIRIERPGKSPPQLVVTSWRGRGTTTIGGYQAGWKPEQPLIVVTHTGALGREYVTSVSAVPAPAPGPPGDPD